jgi:16S rRNA pseudouridine516 synthase
MRLDRYLSNATLLSRSQAREAIKGGRVAVNGEPVRQAARPVPLGAAVALDGEMLGLPGYRYFMLNKPPGYVCATEDRQHSTVLELLHEPVIEGLHVAGRLDIDVTGLVLVTDDGAWSHRVTSPRHKCAKTYRAALAEPLAEAAVRRLREGIMLRGEKRPTRPAGVALITPQQVRLTISEGRYHQVKRMFAAVGNRVLSLHREGIGDLTLDPQLDPGDYRPLTPAEVEALGRPANRLEIPLSQTEPSSSL